MSDPYKRRFTPQNRENKRGLPQILPAKVNLNNELDAKINSLVISAKKTGHTAHAGQYGNIGPGKHREKSAGARFEDPLDKRPSSFSKVEKAGYMIGTKGEKYVGPPPKDFSPHLRSGGGPKSPVNQQAQSSHEKRGRSSNFTQDKLYSSFYNDVPTASSSFGWTRTAKQQSAVKTEANARGSDLAVNKSVNSLLASSLQGPPSKLRTQVLQTRPQETLQRNFGVPAGGPVRVTQKTIPKNIPRLDQPRVSTTSFHIIKSYAVNTCKGLVRPYNEDRVSIILNMIKPEDKKCARWPVCSFFGVRSPHLGLRRTRGVRLFGLPQRQPPQVHSHGPGLP